MKEEKMTKQKLAEMYGISPKTWRERRKYADILSEIEMNIGKERADALDKVMIQLQGNKKEMLSADNMKQLSMLPNYVY